ncbi:hypothetical protein CHFL109739_00305 [Chryseobacterium flavum]
MKEDWRKEAGDYLFILDVLWIIYHIVLVLVMLY